MYKNLDRLAPFQVLDSDGLVQSLTSSQMMLVLLVQAAEFEDQYSKYVACSYLRDFKSFPSCLQLCLLQS